MNIFIVVLFYIIAILITIRTISYGVFEIKQKNKFGGSLVILIAIASFVFFAVMMSLQ